MPNVLGDDFVVASNANPSVPGVLRFQNNASGWAGGYAIYKTGNGHLQFQGGTAGYLWVNTANSAVLARMSETGEVDFWAPATSNAVQLMLKSSAGVNQLGMYAATSDGHVRIAARGTLSLHADNVGYSPTREIVRLVSETPTASDARVEIRSTGTAAGTSGAAMLVFRTADNVIVSPASPDRLGVYVDTVSGETRIAAHGGLAFSAGNAAYTGGNEVMRLLPNKNVGIGITDPASRLVVKAADDLQTTNIIETLAQNATIGIAIGFDAIRMGGSAPNSPLRISSKGTGHLLLQTLGGANVGIGTITPGALLQVGDVTVERPGTIRMASKYQGGNRQWEIGTDGSPTGWGYGFAIRDLGASATRLLIDLTGNVGIGITPQAKLHVAAGGIKSDGGIEAGGAITTSAASQADISGSGDVRTAKKFIANGRTVADTNGCYYA